MGRSWRSPPDGLGPQGLTYWWSKVCEADDPLSASGRELDAGELSDLAAACARVDAIWEQLMLAERERLAERQAFIQALYSRTAVDP